MQNSSRPAESLDGTAAAPTTAPDEGAQGLADVGHEPTKPVPTGLAGRVYLLRAEQAALDGETRMRRLLIGLLIIQVPVVIVMLLSGAFVALVVDIIAVAVQIAAAQVFGPHDGDRHVPAKDEAMEQLISGQRAELAALREQADRAGASSSMLAELARRHRALLVRQLTKIDELEAREADPTALGDLFALDHLATRMRRCSEGVLVLSGRDEIRSTGTPVVASEVLRGAVAEIEDFSRVEVTLDRDVTIVGPAVVDVVHLLAEIIENATICSAATTVVRVHGHSAGEAFAVTVTDQGVGMLPERLAELNRFLAEDDLPATSGQIGFQVVAKLAARHGIYVGLAASATGGTEATVVLPATLVAGAARPAAAPAVPVAPAPPATPPPSAGALADASSDDVAPVAHDLPLERELAAALDDAPHFADASPFADAPPFAEPLAEPVAYGVRSTSWDDPPAESAWTPGPVVEETSWDLPAYEEPSYEGPAYEQAAYDLPAAEQPAYDLPAAEQPAYDLPAAEQPAYDLPAADQPFVSYEQLYSAEADLPAPPWEDLAWAAPVAPPAVPVAEPEAWRETTQSPFVPAARVVEQTAAPAYQPEHHLEPRALHHVEHHVEHQVEQRVEPPVADAPDDDLLTESGLRRRVPLANMAPQMTAPSPVLADDTVAEPAPDRSRHLFSAYRDGLTLGRGGLSSELAAAENIVQQQGETEPGEGDD